MNFIRLDITISDAEAASAPDLADMHARCFSHPWNRASFETFLKDRHHRALTAKIASAPDDPVGFVLIRHIGMEAEILSVAVLPEHHNKGVATGLLYRICELMKLEGVRRVFLEVGRGNASALRLYENMNFTEVGQRRAYYRGEVGEAPDDAIIMEKTL